MTQSELKRFPDHKFGHAFTTIKCECSSYLPWLEQRFDLYIKTLTVMSDQTIIIIFHFKFQQSQNIYR